MDAAFLAAFILQWVVLIGLAVLVVGLFRQVGTLHERLGPVGALTLPGGPAVGAQAPEFDLPSLNGGSVRLGGADVDGRATLLFFLSPTCPICKSMLPVLFSIVRETPSARLVFASDGDEEKQRLMISQERLTGYPFVLSSELGRSYGVGKLPYAILVGPDGRIAAKGLVNNREHLESLLEAQRVGIASLQDYIQQKSASV